MGYKNPKELLADAIKFPAAIEGMLPEGAPKLSERLAETTGKLPDLPDFVVEIPTLPAPPERPKVGALGRGVRARTVTERPPAAAPTIAGKKVRFLY